MFTEGYFATVTTTGAFSLESNGQQAQRVELPTVQIIGPVPMSVPNPLLFILINCCSYNESQIASAD